MYGLNFKKYPKISFRTAKTGLNRQKQLVIELRYGLYGEKEVTQQEIAKLLGISRSYVSRIEKKALKKLYAEMKQIK